MNQYKRMGNKLSKRIRNLGSKMDHEYYRMNMVLMVFKLFGLAPWVIERTSPRIKLWNDNVPQTLSQTQLAYSKFGCVYHIVIIVFVVVSGIWVSVFSGFDEVDYPNKTQVTWLLDMSLMVSSYVVVTAIRLVLCSKQATAVRLFNRLTTIDGTITFSANIRNYESNRLFFVLLLSIDGFAWVVGILTTHFFYDVLFESLFANISVDMTVSWFVVQYVIVVKLIERKFRALNRAILDTSNYSGIRLSPSLIVSDDPMHSVQCRKILNLRQTHISLCEIANDIAGFYSLPILFAIPYLCSCAVYVIYLSVILVLLQGESYSPYVTIDSIAWLIVYMFPIIMLAAGISKTNSEMSKSAQAVHALIARPSTSRKDKSELRQFSLELYRRNVEFSVCGLFSLDCALLYSIFSAVMTYLIIIIQLQLAGKIGNLLTTESYSTPES